MGNLRPVLLIGLLFLGYMIWVEWQKDYGPQPATATEPATSSRDRGEMPAVPPAASGQAGAAEDLPQPGDQPDTQALSADAPVADSEPAPRPLIEVTTDVLIVRIDPVGGTVVDATLRSYPVDLEKPDDKVALLQPGGPGRFIARGNHRARGHSRGNVDGSVRAGRVA